MATSTGQPSGSADAHPWLGKWKSTDRDTGFDNILAALGLPVDKMGGNLLTTHTIRKDGDHYIDLVELPTIGYKEEYRFRLNKMGCGTKFHTTYRYVFYEKDGELHTASEFPELDRKFHEWSKVVNGELVKTYEVGDVVAQRWYVRVPSA